MPIFLSFHFDHGITSDVRHLIDQHFEQYKDDLSPQHASTFTCALTPSDSLQHILTLHKELISSNHAATMAFHVGKAIRLRETYAGPSVEHVRCLAESGSPGQILLSQTFVDTNYLPPDAEVEDLGRYRLKDLTPSEHVYQLVHPSLSRQNFSSLRTLDSVPNNFRPQSRPFIGRYAERAVLTAMLQTGDHRLITLRGPGGIGKTRLALQIAAETATFFTDGVYFLSLESTRTPDGFASIIIDALSIPVRGSRSTHDQLLAHLHEKNMLLILDNFEQLLPPPELLRQILNVARNVSLLVTSRAALEIPEEQEYPVAGLSYPPENNGHEAGVYDAVQLFVQAAQRVDPLFTVSNKNRASVHRICRHLVGMPLGIELAAAWVRVFSPMEIADHLMEDLEALATNRRDIVGRHRSLRLVFDHSWRLLTTEEQDIFLYLTVFQGAFREEAALEIAGASREILDSLCANSLLSQSSDQRYCMLRPIQQFAAKDLSLRTNVWLHLKDQHARYYTDLVASHTSDLWTDRQRVVVHKLAPEIQDIRAAWLWAAERGEVGAVEKSIEFIYRFHQVRGYFQEGESLFKTARDKLESTVSDAGTAEIRGVLARLQENAAMFSFHLSKLKEAREKLEESLAVFQELSLQRYEGFAYMALGMIAYEYGQLGKAETFFKRSHMVLNTVDDSFGRARSIYQLGNVHYASGRYQDALSHYRRSMEIHENLGEHLGIADCLYSVGCTESIMAHFDKAKKALVQSRNIYQDLGDKRGLSAVQIEMGLIATLEGRFWDAESYSEEALALRKELGDPALIAEATIHLAGAAYTLGNFNQVKRLANTVWELRSEYQQPVLLGFTSALWGILHIAQGQLEEGVANFEDAVDALTKTGYQRECMRIQGYLILVLILQGRLERAERLCLEDLDQIDSTGARQFRCYRLTGLGMINSARQSYTKAKAYLQQAVVEGVEIGMKPAAIDALQNLASQIIARRDPEVALAWLTMVVHHPASDAFQKQTAQQAAEQLAEQLPVKRVEAARERGRHLTLNEIAAEIRSKRREPCQI